jgi:hypothetical protein
MNFRTAVFFFGLSILTPVPSYSAAPDMQEGNWEMTIKTEMEGMPIAMPATKHTVCITKEDLVPQKPEQNQDCKMTNQKVSGNTVTWTMKCKMDKTVVDSNGKITYKKDKFDGVINISMNDPHSGKMNMTQNMSGKRIGECKK